jgi:NADH:ubiquinone oxidoreductase subunit F (NADH-binding)
MQRAPHLVLDGVELAAVSVGAREARLVVADRAARRSLDEAMAERRGMRRSRVRIRIMAVEDRFVAGESTAVVRASEGEPPGLPKFTVRRTGEGGVNGRPTLVSNVETLAHLAILARLGCDGYRSAGTESEAGTALLTAHLHGAPPEVLEVPYGKPLRHVLGSQNAPRAVLVGGYHGQWLSPGAAAHTVLSRAGLKEAGGDLGAGVVVALPDDACPLVEAAPVVRMLADASSGQCGPCVHGLRSIADRFQAVADSVATQDDLRLLDRWATLVRGRGACSHPDGVVRFVGSLLTAFASEVAVHQHLTCDRSFQGLLPVQVH